MSTFAVMGVHVNTAPAWMRDILAAPYSGTHMLQLAIPDISVVVIQTCNRFELYCVSDTTDISQAIITNHVSQLYGLVPAQLMQHSYWYRDGDVATHLLRVACGLDSVVLGEAQILGQLRQCLQQQHPQHRALRQLFVSAIQAGRQVRHHTDIGRYSTSIAQTAVELLRQQSDDSELRVLVLGAGDMATLAVNRLVQDHIHVTICNRSWERGMRLAQRYGVTQIPWEARHQALATHNGVIVATAAPDYVLTSAHDVELARHCVIVDIAMPRNVDPLMAHLPQVALFEIDDLQHVIDAHRSQRMAAIPHVEQIITHYQARWSAWQHQQQHIDEIKALRKWAYDIYACELARAQRQLVHAPETSAAILDEFGHRLTQKLLHPTTIALRNNAASPSYSESHLIHPLTRMP